MSSQAPVLENYPSVKKMEKMIREEKRKMRGNKRQTRLASEKQPPVPPNYVTSQPPIWNGEACASSLVMSQPPPSDSLTPLGVPMQKIKPWPQITEFIDGTIKRRWRNAWDLITSGKRMGDTSKRNRNFVLHIKYQKNTDQFRQLFQLYDIDAKVEDVIQSVEKIRQIEADAVAKKTLSDNYMMDSYVANLAIAMLSATLFTTHKTIAFHTKIFNDSRYDANSHQKYWEMGCKG